MKFGTSEKHPTQLTRVRVRFLPRIVQDPNETVDSLNDKVHKIMLAESNRPPAKKLAAPGQDPTHAIITLAANLFIIYFVYNLLF